MDKENRSKIRFTLADLFWLVPLTAAFAHSSNQIGTLSVAIAIVVSVALLLFNSLVRQKSKRVYVWLTLIPLAMFCTIPIFQINVTVISLIALCVVLRIVLSQGVEISARWLFHISTITAAITLFASCNFVSPGLAKFYRLRESNPIEFLSERLQFEPKPNLASQNKTSPSAIVQANLGKTEKLATTPPNWFRSRKRGLENLHNQQTEQFLRANGFGVGRMGFLRVPHESIVGWPKISEIAFQEVGEFEHDQYFNRQVSPEDIESSFNGADKTHYLNWFNFLDPASFGWTKEFQTTAGFVPHAFHKPASKFEYQGVVRQLESLLLISLHRFDEPRVYVLDHLPRMDQLSSEDAQTRPVNEFEKQALSKLAYQSDIEIHTENDRLLMLGSIRANESCLQCHAVEPGDLLGAFTYRFK